MKTNEIQHAIWMLSSAIQSLSKVLDENLETKWQIEWLTHAVDCMSEAEKAIEKTNILPF